MNLAINTKLDSTRQEESVGWTVAILVHGLLLFWNPTLLSSHYKPVHDFVQIDIVEQSGPGGFDQEAPKAMGLMDTLKDMLMKPRAEQIPHISNEPLTNRVAAPVQPALKEKSMPRPISTMFQPKSQAEDLASSQSPNAIKTESKNYAMPSANPALSSKSFGGIRAKDLPFQVGTDQNISGQTVVPIAVGNSSAKSALGYSAPTLTDSSKKTRGINVSAPGSGPAGDINAIGGGSAATIQISGTGGTGNAPTGATRGSVLEDRSGGAGGGGRVGRGLFGGGGGRGTGFGSGTEGIPGAAGDLNAGMGTAGGSSTGAKSKKGFEISGPLNNRPILHKVIPQYPAWAEEQGIIGSVRIWFTVTPEGQVRSNMRVTKTTGYPELDKLALDALKQWRFAGFSAADDSSQWGIITFTFSLSS